MMSRGQARTLVTACSILGMACWWPFFRNSFFGMVLYNDGMYGDVRGIYLSSVAMLGAFSLIACAVSGMLAHSRRHLPFLTLGPSVLFLALCVILRFNGGSGLISAVLACMSAMCASFAAGCLAVSWFMATRMMLLNRAFFVSTASFFMSFLIPYIAHFYGEQVMWWTNVLSLGASSVFLAIGALLRGRCDWVPEGHHNHRYDMNSHEMVLVLVFFLLVGSLFRGVFSQGVLDYSPGAESEFRYIEALIFSAVVMVVSLFFSMHRSFFTMAWMVFALVFLLGLLALSAIDSSDAEPGVSTVITARTFLALLLWIVLAWDARDVDDANAVRKVSMYFILVEALAQFLTSFFVPMILDDGVANVGGRASSLWMAIVLVVGSFAYFGRLVLTRPAAIGGSAATSGKLKDEACAEESGSTAESQECGQTENSINAQSVPDTAQTPKARVTVCESIARRYSLTEREKDVLFAMSQGHSVKKMAEMLFMSTGTVQSHVKHLYRKTDCHSRQDIIDLVDSELAGK